MRHQTHHGPCADSLTLQQLLDGELAPVLTGLVLHHARSCAGCRQALEELSALHDGTVEALAMEDQANQDWTDMAVGRIASTMLAASRAGLDRHAWFRGWRLAGIAAVATLVVLAPPLLPLDAGASGERIARESILRERAWMARPDTVRHWVVESDIRNRPGVRDGRYRRDVWQRTGRSGDWARVTRQYDGEGLVSATWRREDGSSVSWLAPRPDEIVVRPSTAALQEALPGLPDELRRALAAHIAQRQQSGTIQSQQLNFAEYLRRATAQGNPAGSFERISTGDGQDLYRVRTDVAFSGRHRPVTRLEQEDYIGVDDFRRYRLLTRRHFESGTIETEDSRTTYFDRASEGEFGRQTLEDLIARASCVVALTPAEIAREQLERERFTSPAARAAGTDAGWGQESSRALRPGDHAVLTIRWSVEDGYYLDEKTTSSLVFKAPAGIAVSPAKVETSGRIVGVAEQTASVSVGKDVAAGRHPVKVEAVIFFCSLREQWCKRVTRTIALPVEVSPDAGAGQKTLDLELPVPLDDER